MARPGPGRGKEHREAAQTAGGAGGAAGPGLAPSAVPGEGCFKF